MRFLASNFDSCSVVKVLCLFLIIAYYIHVNMSIDKSTNIHVNILCRLYIDVNIMLCYTDIVKKWVQI
jgi:hypothetical protein